MSSLYARKFVSVNSFCWFVLRTGRRTFATGANYCFSMKRADNELKAKVRYPVRYPGKIGMFSTNQQNFGHRATEMRKATGRTQKQLADQLGVSITSVQNYESGRVPNGEILVKLAAALDCTPEWLVTGEGEMKRGQAAATPTAPERPVQQAQASIYNDMNAEEFNMGEILAKTIDILNSKTIYTTAIVSNINAFHEAISTRKQVDDMQAQLNQALSSFQTQLDKIQVSNQQIKEENAQLRQELESCRVQPGLEDTG